ncbi:MAG: hypothetical protein K9J74_13040 [Sulfuritalea sp.]|nr:hypothetical protein [Sulfuritalea sp.]
MPSGNRLDRSRLKLISRVLILTMLGSTLAAPAWGTSTRQKKAKAEEKREKKAAQARAKANAPKIAAAKRAAAAAAAAAAARTNAKNMATLLGSLEKCNSPAYAKLVAPKMYVDPAPLDSPGFHIRNETNLIVDVSLEQVGPLYWGMVKPGQTWHKPTGAVWFSIKASYNIDGKEKYDTWDAVWPVVDVTASVIAGVMTGGGATAAAQATTWGATIAKAAAEESLQVVVKKAGMAAAKAGLNSVAKASAEQAAKTGFEQAMTKGAVAATKEVAAKVGQDLAKNFLSSDKASDAIYGQYAGAPLGGDTLDLYRITGNAPTPCLAASGEVNWSGAGHGMAKALKIVPEGIVRNPGEDRFTLQIDCHSSGVPHAATQNPINVTFFDGNTRLRALPARRPKCNSMHDDSHFYTYAKHVTHVEVRNTGTDDLWMDEVRLIRTRFDRIPTVMKNRVPQYQNRHTDTTAGWWGREDALGFCTTSNGATAKDMIPHAANGRCWQGIRFSVDAAGDLNKNTLQGL